VLRTTARSACLALALAACAASDAFLPAGAVPFTPPPTYRLWWRAVEQCSGLTGRFEAVAWFVVPDGQPLLDPAARQVRALWVRQGNRVILQAQDTATARTPQHEMLHALLQQGGHPTEYFVTRCALGVN
jgi:ABC-type sugar transport system substrate-binding protein